MNMNTKNALLGVFTLINVCWCTDPNLLNINRDSLTATHEFFTAASDMDILWKVEKKLAKRFLKYYKEEMKRLDRLEEQIKEIDLPPKSLKYGKDELWASRITNAHKIIQRFTRFWSNITKHSKQQTTGKKMTKLRFDLNRLKRAYPSDADLKGSLAAVLRLEDTYDISPAEFSKGLAPYSHLLSIEEMFEIGFLCVGMADYYHSKQWFEEALRQFPSNINQVGFLDKVSLIEYLAWSEYQLGNLEKAIDHSKVIIKLNPAHKAARVNKDLFETDLWRSKTDPSVRKVFVRPHPQWEVKYDLLCQGLEPMDQEVINQLFCRYGSPTPRFILKPLKIEHAYNNPHVYIYHDLLRDFEMDHIKEKAFPLLSRATVHHPTTQELMYADYRVSKSAWISPDMDEVASNIINKVGEAVNLDMRYSEELQIANYGLAGQYEPHYDHATFDQPKNFARYGGNRIATMLMYMSEVYRGGGTVFTNTGKGVAITVEKGAGVFWFNLLKNGKHNPRTQHGGCPVVIGQKWVSNLWIHEHGQEFRRPCTLNKDE